MARLNQLFIGLIALSMAACTWPVRLVIANNSKKDIFIRYIINSNLETSQFFKEPATYLYDESLRKLNKQNEVKRPKRIPSDITTDAKTNEIKVKLAPGQAVHVGGYASYQSREEILSEYSLKVVISEDSTLSATPLNDHFKHWKSATIDVLEIGQ